MKKLLYYSILAATIFFAGYKASAQNANTSLSNLAAPTKINANLFPDKDGVRNLGSFTKRWKNIYLDSAVYLGGSRFIASQSGTGIYNTAIGASALLLNTSGSYNTANGFYSLFTNTTGNDNTAAGHYSLFSNTTGSYNNANGIYAMVYNTSGNYNLAEGSSAMYYNTTGSANTAVGYNALYNTTASLYNTAVGFNAGHTYDNGYNNVFVGANTDVSGAGYYNVIAIGQGTVCTGSSQVTMGNGATGSYRAYANWSNISDGRFKKNIKQNVPGLVFINKLQPVTYTLDATGIDNFLHADQPQDKQISGQAKALMSKALSEKEKVTYTGFIAQDVEKAAKSLNYDFSGVDAAKNSKDVYGLRYAEFVVPLVKAVQELSKMNDAKDSAIQQQNSKIDNLQQQINDLKNLIKVINNSSTSGNAQAAIISSASLLQNVPNPFTSSTTISYSIPQKYSSAKIVVTDKNGAALKQFSLSAGNGSVTINASTLSSGVYQYALFVDGRMIDSKQMILTK
ncbi:MAG: tail fiber domain-containing protein [Parafilimonas sp.]